VNMPASHSDVSRNIELKARVADFDAARTVARRIATEHLGTQRQVDTYFHCRHGRLKLREIEGSTGQLVGYARPDEPGPKASDYMLVPIADPGPLKATLAAALGVQCVVEKQREIFLFHNVRIHLDEVKGLGRFLEFEAVLGPEADDAEGRSQVDRLIAEFSIEPGDLLPGSYADMLT
jgi:adenylate cyclase class 2